MARRRVLFFNETSGVGDDLMVYWAAVAAASLQLFSEPITICFQRAAINDFLRALPVVPGLNLIAAPEKDDFVTYSHTHLQQFETISLGQIASLLLKRSSAFCDQYYHKVLSEYGRRWQPGWRYRLSVAVGALKVWSPPYPDIYDGWQSLAVVAGLSKAAAEKTAPSLASAWARILSQLKSLPEPSSGETLLFPAGGSFQDFPDTFIEKIRRIWPELKIARYIDDQRPADLVYKSLDELRRIVAAAEHVITNDSSASHIAQFFARRHTLICTRSRPGNICFPGAARTAVLDLGVDLPCRPCVYLGLSEGRCAAGFSRCAGQEKELTA